MSNYAYILFHGFCVLASISYYCNGSIDNMDSSGEEIPNDDARHREIDKEIHKKKGKDIIIDDDMGNNLQMSGDYILYDCYTILIIINEFKKESDIKSQM
jgi:hypothetical protein